MSDVDTQAVTVALNHAVRLLQNGQVENARYVCSQVVAHLPAHPGALYLMGLCDLAERRFEDAVQHLQQAVGAGQPAHAQATRQLGYALFTLGRHAEALQAYETALQACPGHARLLAGKGSMQAQLHHPREGLATLQQAHPDVDIYTAAIDRGLNAHGYIVPGLGDAGDRIFGTT